MALCSYCHQNTSTAHGCTTTTGYCPDSGKTYTRLRVQINDVGINGRCNECGAERNFHHHPGCSRERCPICHRQVTIDHTIEDQTMIDLNFGMEKDGSYESIFPHLPEYGPNHAGLKEVFYSTSYNIDSTAGVHVRLYHQPDRKNPLPEFYLLHILSWDCDTILRSDVQVLPTLTERLATDLTVGVRAEHALKHPRANELRITINGEGL